MDGCIYEGIHQGCGGWIIVPHLPQMPLKMDKGKGKASPKKSPGKEHDEEEVEPPPLNNAKNEPQENQSHAIGEKKRMDKMCWSGPDCSQKWKAHPFGKMLS